MSDRFRLIIPTILKFIWALVWRLTVSISLGKTVSHFLPHEHETYTQGSKINALFQIAVRPTDDSSCAVKPWNEFNAEQDKVCTYRLDQNDCYVNSKITCNVKRISTEEYELIYTDPFFTEERTSHYRITEGRVEHLSFTFDSSSRRFEAGLLAGIFTLLLTLVPLLYCTWRRRRKIQAAAKKARMTEQHKD